MTTTSGRSNMGSKPPEDSQAPASETDRLPGVIKKIAVKFITLQVILLPVLMVIVATATNHFKKNIAQNITDIVRENLLIGDTRKAIFQLRNFAMEGFSNVAWQSRDFSQKFELKPERTLPSPAKHSSIKTTVYFDANKTQPAGELVFYYTRADSMSLSFIIWSLFFFVFIAIGYNESKTFLREYNTSLKLQVLEANSSMAAQVAHDIRSPLAALDAALKNTPQLPEKQRVIVRHAVNRIRDIANNLLEKNRQQAGAPAAANAAAGGHVAGEPPTVHLLSSLIDPVITEKRLSFESKSGVNIDFKLTRESYGLFAGIQPVEFRRMLSNLVNNAVEALDDKGAVDVSLNYKDESIALTVSDNGKGIPPEILAKLGQRGETHGKADGSGLGLFHARTTAESWGGSLAITSTPGQGTAVTIKLPRAAAPAGFVPALTLPPGRPVVVLDDDATIHQVWQGRFDSAWVKEHNIEIIHFSEPDKLRAWVKDDPARAESAVYLFDYELLGFKETGLSLTEELGLSGKTILVTSRYEEKRIIEECGRLKIRMIPKGLADFVPIQIGETKTGSAAKSARAVLLDDDALTHMNWEYAAQENGIELRAFTDPARFMASLGDFPRDIPLYIDSELGENIKGENIAADLKEKGFTNIYLATGHPPEKFAHLP
ncbi:MAG: HAMP domain-containing sensor histidine kinase, partial [Elusimicrobiota bacterium]